MFNSKLSRQEVAFRYVRKQRIFVSMNKNGKYSKTLFWRLLSANLNKRGSLIGGKQWVGYVCSFQIIFSIKISATLILELIERVTTQYRKIKTKRQRRDEGLNQWKKLHLIYWDIFDSYCTVTAMPCTTVSASRVLPRALAYGSPHAGAVLGQCGADDRQSSLCYSAGRLVL